MNELVLKLDGMVSSIYAQPLPEAFQVDVASGRLQEGKY